MRISFVVLPALSILSLSTTYASAQVTDPAPLELVCAADDIPCIIARMNRKGGGGTGSGGVKDDFDPGGITSAKKGNFDDLGEARIPSEDMRLPQFDVQSFGKPGIAGGGT
jgi:hypothetical protein